MNNKNNTSLSEAVMRVWGEYDDFKQGGIPYVLFVQQENIQDIEDAKTDQEIVNELADQVIVSLRQIEEMEYDADEIIRSRLFERMDGQQEDIIDTYQSMYQHDE